MTYEHTIPSPLGPLRLIASDKGLRTIWMGRNAPSGAKKETNPVLKQAAAELAEYFAGKRRRFTVPLEMEGTEFERTVWRALLTIPYGETRSYGAIAKQIGSPGAARAVGRANSLNPIGIVVPCHRVIGANGKLTGYAGGLHNKEYLLQLESGRKTA